MIGNSKNTDSERKVLIEETKEEDLKIYSDLLKIHMDISIGKQLEISPPCLKLWLLVSFYYGALLFFK